MSKWRCHWRKTPGRYRKVRADQIQQMNVICFSQNTLEACKKSRKSQHCSEDRPTQFAHQKITRQGAKD